MISVETKPLTLPEIKQIEDWMNHAGALLFMKVLAHRVAKEQAESANQLIRDPIAVLKAGVSALPSNLTIAVRHQIAYEVLEEYAAKKGDSVYQVTNLPCPPIS